MRGLVAAIALAFACSASAASSERAQFIYDDIDRFAVAHSAIERGEDAGAALKEYIEGATPAFVFYANRYDVTADSIAKEIKRRPKFYARLAQLKPRLQQQEPVIVGGLARLAELARSKATAPITFLVANQVAGGTPVELDDAKPPALGIAIAADMVSMASDVDMTEFPKGPGGRAELSDIPYVAIHEMAHVHQVGAQGGLDNYRSIYRPGPNSSNLAVAIREGCADYLTFLASGLERTGQQDAYGRSHERELWEEFRKVIDAPAFSAPGWFSGTNDRFREWPSQIGYWLGRQMCSHYHQSAVDKDRAVDDMFMAYRPEQVRKFAEAYAGKFAD